MNYRHIYHAGNFADVFKHISLVALTKTFLKKPTAFCYVDTHAGKGSYDLNSSESKRTHESDSGIKKIINAPQQPLLVQEYLNSVKKLNQNQEIMIYPGSPFFVNVLKRSEDRVILCELNGEEYRSLKSFFGTQKNLSIHQQDGYLALKAFLPPKEKRGFVLIDPPYEKNNEYELLESALANAIHRWPNGVFALWYPIKKRETKERFINRLLSKVEKPSLQIELCVNDPILETHLNGSGLFIINPPWKFEEEIETILPWLWETLAFKKAGYYAIKR